MVGVNEERAARQESTDTQAVLAYSMRRPRNHCNQSRENAEPEQERIVRYVNVPQPRVNHEQYEVGARRSKAHSAENGGKVAFVHAVPRPEGEKEKGVDVESRDMEPYTEQPQHSEGENAECLQVFHYKIEHRRQEHGNHKVAHEPELVARRHSALIGPEDVKPVEPAVLLNCNAFVGRDMQERLRAKHNKEKRGVPEHVGHEQGADAFPQLLPVYPCRETGAIEKQEARNEKEQRHGYARQLFSYHILEKAERRECVLIRNRYPVQNHMTWMRVYVNHRHNQRQPQKGDCLGEN